MSKPSTTISTFIANFPVVGHRRTGDRPRLRIASSRLRSQAGQATAEYGLVILAAAALAGVLLAGATGNGGVNRLMDAVMDSIIANVTGP
ncbi:MAG: DUF4244 domain-containing protein [Acidimicrobiia bacterium]|nr:DUF4244 domain-containing protein [Acidimicrobiia bacterium]